ncbi:MAG: hypothetical protein LV479_01600, partial [Methylacidiphilales bacterium]|nr:hypothetical protein [Candidatus Methylacidiphilales bacterium]
GNKIKVLQVIRGSVEGQVTISFKIRGGLHEQPPQEGDTYIFFAHKNTEPGWDNYTVLKLLPATDDNIAKVKALIAAAPAPK